MENVLGVGLVGSGTAAQGIHLPALQSLPHLYRIVHCFDPDQDVAQEVARRTHAKHSTDLEEIMSDPHVDVVVITTPVEFHHPQVVRAIETGKRGVLCESPLAQTIDEARDIAEESRSRGVPVLTGSMHRYDPAVREIERVWGTLPLLANIVRTTTYVPPNALMAGLSTEVIAARPPAPAAPSESGAGTDQPLAPQIPFEVLLFKNLMLGLAVHDLPFVRMAMPENESVEVEVAELLGSAGYEVVLRSGDRVAELSAMLYDFPRTEWSFELIADEAHAKVSFPPGYLASQSAQATLWLGAGGYLKERTFGAFYETGYRAEWRNLHEAVVSGAELLATTDSAVLDMELGSKISDAFESRLSARV